MPAVSLRDLLSIMFIPDLCLSLAWQWVACADRVQAGMNMRTKPALETIRHFKATPMLIVDNSLIHGS